MNEPVQIVKHDVLSQVVKMTPKDFFLNLGIVVALYTSAITFLTLLFEIIDRVFVDSLGQNYYNYGYYSAPIRFAIASLIVMFPLTIVLNYFNNKLSISAPEKKKLAIRRWLSYITLFFASLAIAIDLITLINSFLGGEITSRFVYKVLSVLMVAGIVLYYYVYDLKNDSFEGKTNTVITIITSLLVVSGIVVGFITIGSPLTQRQRAFDERRVSDLQDLQWRITTYREKTGAVPTDLGKLIDSINGYTVPIDPKTKKGYVYEFVSPNNFKICAEFELSNRGMSANNDRYVYDQIPKSTPMLLGEYDNQNWIHDKGLVCFDRFIDPKLYPIKDGVGGPTDM